MTRRRAAGAALAVAVLAAAFAYAFRAVDAAAALAAVREADAALLTAAALTTLAAMLVQGQRLHALVGAVAPLSRRDAAEAAALGFASSQFLPARGGEIVKAGYLARVTCVGSAALVGLVTLENVVNAGTLLALALAVAYLEPAPAWVRRLALVGTAALPLALWLLTRLKPMTVDPARRRLVLALQRLSRELHHGLTPVRRPRVLAGALALSAAAWGLELATARLTLAAFDAPSGTGTALVLMLGVNAALLLPVTPGQLGVYELTAAVVLRQAGLSPSTALVVALFYHLVHLVPTLALAGGFLVHRQLRRATPV